MARRGHEPEARVVCRVTENDDEGAVSPAQGVNPRPNQQGSYALALAMGSDGHRREAHALDGDVPGGDRHGAEEDVSHDGVVIDGDEGYGIGACSTDGVNDVGLSRLAEGRLVDGADSGVVVGLLRSYVYPGFVGV